MDLIHCSGGPLDGRTIAYRGETFAEPVARDEPRVLESPGYRIIIDPPFHAKYALVRSHDWLRNETSEAYVCTMIEGVVRVDDFGRPVGQDDPSPASS